MKEEKKRIIKILRSFPLSESHGVEFVFNEDNWKAGYAALDTVADYLEIEDEDNKAKAKLKKSLI